MRGHRLLCSPSLCRYQSGSLSGLWIIVGTLDHCQDLSPSAEHVYATKSCCFDGKQWYGGARCLLLHCLVTTQACPKVFYEE